MSFEPSFPPMLDGRAVPEPPFDAAIRAAATGAEAGLVLYDPSAADLAVSLVLVPEVPIEDSAVMLPLAGVALQNALGALGPAELPVHLGWDGTVYVNGGRCGRVRAAVPETSPGAAPDWLVLGAELRFRPVGDGGEAPEETALHAEGCGDLTPMDLTESWARHALLWIHGWEEDGVAPLHREWSGLARGMGEPIEVAGRTGTFLGLDERLGLLLKTEAGATEALPLTELLEVR
ncbi:biotin/lipoate--protein ligase family protein [Roseivivax sediminis]|uniref:Biotin-(Acetyl-CoA carboxylase) ligase n=1 Tax=Roseivivax sediminis TaxID=936889 RepID=A0A1I1SKQ9_9RHOB|nr:biotin/lipoate--protein ligase family protein [Roseivivax sediminis]SFD47059.1 Biotin-(acetyl-CoA carboxylase) ligase [Roseivivax sediminis]